jgi:hypothetical protein
MLEVHLEQERGKNKAKEGKQAGLYNVGTRAKGIPRSALHSAPIQSLSKSNILISWYQILAKAKRVTIPNI